MIILPQGTQPNTTYLEETYGSERIQSSNSPAATAVQPTPRSGTPLFSYPVSSSSTVPALPVSSNIQRPVSPASTISNVPLFYYPTPQQTTPTSQQPNGPTNIPLFYYPTPRSGASTPEESPSASPSSTPRTWRPRSQSMNSSANTAPNNSHSPGRLFIHSSIFLLLNFRQSMLPLRQFLKNHTEFHPKCLCETPFLPHYLLQQPLAHFISVIPQPKDHQLIQLLKSFLLFKRAQTLTLLLLGGHQLLAVGTNHDAPPSQFNAAAVLP